MSDRDWVVVGSEVPPRWERWSPETKRYVLTLSLLVFVGLLYLARSVLPLVLWAAIIAFLLNPFVTLLTRIYIPRVLATLLVYLIFLTALVIVPALVVPLVIQQLMALPLDPRAWALDFYAWSLRLVDKYIQGSILGYPYDLRPYFGLWLEWFQSGQWIASVPNLTQIVSSLQSALNMATTLVVGATGFAGALVYQFVAGVFALFLTMIYTFYLLLIAPRLRLSIAELFPASYHAEIAYLIDQIARTWRSYLRGQVFLCFVIFALSWVGLTLIGMPGAFTLALIAGILEIVPNLGPVLATIPAVIAALIQGSTVLNIPNWQFALVTLALYVIIQQLENNLLVPRVIGSAVNVHPFLVLVGIVVGAQLYGVLGALLAAPTLATLRILAQYVHARLLDKPPFPELLPESRPEPSPELAPEPASKLPPSPQQASPVASSSPEASPQLPVEVEVRVKPLPEREGE